MRISSTKMYAKPLGLKKEEGKLCVDVDLYYINIMMSDRRHNFQFNYLKQFETWSYIYSFNKADGNI